MVKLWTWIPLNIYLIHLVLTVFLISLNRNDVSWHFQFTFDNSPKLYNQHILIRWTEHSSIHKGSVQCSVGTGNIACLLCTLLSP